MSPTRIHQNHGSFCALTATRSAAAGAAALIVSFGASAGSVCPLPSHCVAPDNGADSVTLPGHKAWGHGGGGGGGAGGRIVITNGLDAGDTIECDYRIDSFFDITYGPSPIFPDGNMQSYDAMMTLAMQGTGSLSNLERTVHIPVSLETHCAPHFPPGTPAPTVQTFDTEMFVLYGQLPPGDPDFDLLRIRAGAGANPPLPPSPGHTTLTKLPSGSWAVDSFFDVFCDIEFVGNPGGHLRSWSGSTTGTIRMANTTQHVCLTTVDATGMAVVPASCGSSGGGCCPIGSLDTIDIDVPGVTEPLKFKPVLRDILVTGYSVDATGTTLAEFSGVLELTPEPHPLPILAGVAVPKFLSITAGNGRMSHSAQTQGATVMELDGELTALDAGQLPPGDPDFDLLRVTAGSAFGMPSPGHTTLTRMPASGGTPPNRAVDSFFDITYVVEWTGKNGGPLSGMSGSTTGTIRMGQGGDVPVLEEVAFGLPHSALGQAVVTPVDVDGDLLPDVVSLSNIGSSGQDGVRIRLTPFDSDAGVEGWDGKLDFGPDGQPVGSQLRACFEGAEKALLICVGMARQEDGTTHMGLLPTCDSCGATFELRNCGVVVDSIVHPPGTPPSQMRVIVGAGAGGGPHVRVAAGDVNGDGTADITSHIQTEMVAMSLVGSPAGPVDANEIVMRLNGLPPGIPVKGTLDITAVEIVGLNLASFDITQEALRKGGTQILPGGTARLSGIGDLDGDGLPDIAVTEIGPPDATGALRHGMDVRASDLCGDGPDAIQRFHVEVYAVDEFGNANRLPADAALQIETVDDDGDTLSMAMRRGVVGGCGGGNYCPHFTASSSSSSLAGADSFFDVFFEDTLVGSFPGDATVFSSSDALPNILEGRGSADPEGAGLTFRWTQLPGPITFSAAGHPAREGDRLRARWSSGNPTFPAFRVTGDDLCELLIVDSEITAATPCPADLTGNGTVSVGDLLALISAWGPCPAPCPPTPCPADLTGNCVVNVGDLLALISQWGACP